MPGPMLRGLGTLQASTPLPPESSIHFRKDAACPGRAVAVAFTSIPNNSPPRSMTMSTS